MYQVYDLLLWSARLVPVRSVTVLLSPSPRSAMYAALPMFKGYGQLSPRRPVTGCGDPTVEEHAQR